MSDQSTKEVEAEEDKEAYKGARAYIITRQQFLRWGEGGLAGENFWFRGSGKFFCWGRGVRVVWPIHKGEHPIFWLHL